MNLNFLAFGLVPIKMVVGAFDEDMVTAEEDLTTWIDAAGL